jgi:hypothetical protein
MKDTPLKVQGNLYFFVQTIHEAISLSLEEGKYNVNAHLTSL